MECTTFNSVELQLVVEAVAGSIAEDAGIATRVDDVTVSLAPPWLRYLPQQHRRPVVLSYDRNEKGESHENKKTRTYKLTSTGMILEIK